MKKISAIALGVSIVLGASFFGGCGGKQKAANTETDLEIFYWNSGNGDAWLNKTIEAFTAKYPEVNIIRNFSESNDTWEASLTSPTVNTIDLYISTMTNFLAYTDYIEPLDDVLNVDVDGNGVTLLEKNDKAILDTQRGEDGKLYASMWGGGVAGLVYNKTVFDAKKYTVPRTTDELALLAGDMKDDGYIPFIHCGNADYWVYLLMPWWGQYSGIEEVYNFWQAKYVDEEGNSYQPDIRAMKTEGRRVALEAMEDCVSPKGYTYSASNSTNHTDAQTLFLNGRALMMPNGSWLENEMKSAKTDVEYAFMKTPVVSALGTKLGIGSDRDLGEIVSYVDSADYAAGRIEDGSSEYDAARVKAYSEETIAAVAKARKIVYTEACSGRCIIPNYSVAKDYAKKFVQFMNSDEALKIFTDELHLRTLVTPTVDTVDTSGWSTFMKSADALMNGAEYVYRAKGYKLFYNSSTITEMFPKYAQTYLTATNEKDKMSAQELWEYYCQYYDQYWDSALEQSGLK